MKITITIEETQDGGAFIVMDPGPDELIAQAVAGKGTTAHGCALTAFRAMLEHSREVVAALGGEVDTGEVPARKH